MFDVIGFFARGLLLGLMISAPVGPIGLLCIRRTAQRGLAIGFATGMGAAAADALFGALAAFGVAAILGWVTGYEMQIKVFGGIILIFMAWNAWFKKPHFQHGMQVSVGGVTKAFFSGLALTCTNPVTIVATLGMVAMVGGQMDRSEAIVMTAGILTGAAAWWGTLAGGVAIFRKHFNEKTILVINRSTAVLLLAIAIFAIISGGQGWLKEHHAAVLRQGLAQPGPETRTIQPLNENR